MQVLKSVTKIEPTITKVTQPKRRVAAYCRVSSSFDDQLVSLETQKSHYTEYIQYRPDWEFVGLYVDEGITGTKKEVRPGLQRLLTDCQLGKIDYIVTKSLSRFARNTADCLEMIRQLLGYGIPVYFEKENIDTGTMQDEFLVTLMSSLAEQESHSISENAKWGYQQRFRTGTYKAGYAPYGYTVVDGAYHIQEDEAVWVRYIFDQCLQGKGAQAIAKDLNQKQVLTKRGKYWRESTVLGVLKNEKYIGDCLLQKTYTDDQFKRHTNEGEKEQVYVQENHEPIISRETFELAAKLMAYRGQEKNADSRKGNCTNRYPFSGKIRCGHCGGHVRRRVRHTGSIVYPAWVCQTHIDDIAKCPQKAVKEEVLERAFVTMMNKLVYSRKRILEPLRATLNQQEMEENPEKLQLIESDLEEVETQKNQLQDLLDKGYLNDAAFHAEMERLKNVQAGLEGKRRNLLFGNDGNFSQKAELQKLIHFLQKSTMQRTFQGDVFTAFVDYITIYSQTEFQFHLKCGLTLLERV